ncbi:hypothetical protein NITLEN_10602 [Nitrospira lenta]|uniref:Uncharacterized protein n=1 Tax=Nitrospira lenta TaxID=1436998 RepID=A0A330L9C1_9BACT|nr:hypothetical protein NITLEN_10602 [Nitrospira lenta]
MATPDGISDRDWGKVHTLALLLVTASVTSKKKANKAYSQKLLRYLNRLEVKYGELPSILATRACYIVGNKRKETLLCRAYRLSMQRNDLLNQAEIAHSLSSLYIENLRRYREGINWLGKLKAHARKAKDKYLEQEYDRLRLEAQKIKAKSGKPASSIREHERGGVGS